jgi:hypothetical protein
MDTSCLFEAAGLEGRLWGLDVGSALDLISWEPGRMIEEWETGMGSIYSFLQTKIGENRASCEKRGCYVLPRTVTPSHSGGKGLEECH